MTEPDYGSDRETIWGISRKDRPWFQSVTLLGGISGLVILTLLGLMYRPDDGTPSELALSIVLGIGASFVASGFIAWGLLQIKELTMSIAHWINERRARNREKLLEQGREEGYGLGYEDAQNGRPRQQAYAVRLRRQAARRRRSLRRRGDAG